ncbi:MFS transporter [Streptomyces sp. XM4193]|uniref:MFS transporter n=1 Tax=Streptomyces sp. XM4193 TaxID=2929782 RepID=UPI001FF89074|nr:MFS transporter [Streptomyces sp. XM4193]MCK1795113.1 MFS transporter [Streptomyces sp. XM4193]
MSVETAAPAPLSPRRRRWALVALVLPVLLISVDMTILGFAVPTLSTELEPTGSQLLWMVDVYSFLLAGLLVLMGTLGDRIGRRKLLLLGAFAFGGASVLAAYATSAEMLIAARALLGVGGATLMPSTLSLIRNVFADRRERRTAIAVWAAAFAAGAGLGPVLGGVLLEHFWWGSIFLINVPIMLLLLVLGPVLLPESRDPDPGRFDPLSAVLALAGMLSFVYGVKKIGETGATGAAGLWLLAGLGVGALFVRRQRRSAAPMIDVGLFAHRRFSVSVATNLLAVFALVGLMFFFPQYLQMVHGIRPVEAGLWLLPAAVAAVAGALAAARLARRAPLSHLIGGGLLLAALGYGVVLGFTTGSALWLVVLSAGLVGAGVGLAETLTNDAIIAAAPPEQAGAASAISETAYELGGALGVAVLGSVASSVYREELSAALPAGLPEQAAEAAGETLGGALAVAERLPPQPAEEVLSAAREAFVGGMHVAAVIALVLALCAAVQAAVLLRGMRPDDREAAPGDSPAAVDGDAAAVRDEGAVRNGDDDGGAGDGGGPVGDGGPVGATAVNRRTGGAC